MNDNFHIYDTTLRDGAQQEGLNLSVHDKLAIARHLDDLGVGFIEGGWPGADPKDTEFFKRAQTELKLKNATLWHSVQPVDQMLKRQMMFYFARFKILAQPV